MIFRTNYNARSVSSSMRHPNLNLGASQLNKNIIEIPSPFSTCVYVSTYIYIYIYIYIYVCVCVCVCLCIYIMKIK